MATITHAAVALCVFSCGLDVSDASVAIMSGEWRYLHMLSM